MQDTTYLNGRIEVTTSPSEIRMSHWVNAPRVVNLTNGETLLDLTDGLWDLLKISESPNSLTLVMRKYPGSSPSADLTIDPDQDGFSFNGRRLSSSELKIELEKYH